MASVESAPVTLPTSSRSSSMDGSIVALVPAPVTRNSILRPNALGKTDSAMRVTFSADSYKSTVSRRGSMSHGVESSKHGPRIFATTSESTQSSTPVPRMSRTDSEGNSTILRRLRSSVSKLARQVTNRPDPSSADWLKVDRSFLLKQYTSVIKQYDLDPNSPSIFEEVFELALRDPVALKLVMKA